MPYSDRDYKVSNVNYLNKDFNSLKSTLIEYAKTYFPNTYRDFNETSPGMMLIELSSYVGDVLSYYIDYNYEENLSGNEVSLKQLNPLEQRFLEESLKVILRLQDEVYARFGGIP